MAHIHKPECLSTTRIEGHEDTATNGKDDATENKQSKTIAKSSKKQQFFKMWLKIYSCQAYQKNSNFRYCKVCTEAKKSNEMSKEAKSKYKKSFKILCSFYRIQEYQMVLQGPQIKAI